ncbi:hypothetical protein KVH22_21700 [Streptomyces olivaceus]|uniref:hypothetical protein n=1 Tax=Streptomyces olivaceus TaxID=47716 RepID=UPI001CCA7E14|nr:hypothetical protein [Streptomyces olivaceus]MBZ6258134.1 hypothetical protein [Streptomyces olivaceus]
MSTPFRHPLASHAAGAVIGRRRDGRPIFAIAGGSGEGGTPAAPAAPSAPAAPQAPAVPAAPVTPPAPAPTAPPSAPPAPTAPPAVPAAPAQGEPQDVSGLPQWAQDHIKGLRTEAADWRTRAQGTTPQAPAVPTAPPAPQAPAEAPEGDVSRLPKWAQNTVSQAQAAARQAAVQSAVYTTAAAAGADPAALLDSQAAMTALAAVDPADATAVTAAITAAVQANPRLAAAASGPSRGGADFGSTTPAEHKPANLQDAIAARLAAG